MHGVPADLDLQRFVGTTLDSLTLCQYQASLGFEAYDSNPTNPRVTVVVSVQGSWELRDSSGQLSARGEPDAGGAAHVLHHLLGCTVVATGIDPPSWFSLHFDNGQDLRIFDDSEQYESFSIQPGDIHV